MKPSIWKSTLSGFIATVPMTIAMELLHRRLPRREQYPLPPRQITMKIADVVGAKKWMHEDERLLTTLAGHFGYGALAGMLYTPLSQKINAHPILKGTLFGLIVWTGSYLGILPVVRALPPATQHPARRNLLMITAHLVWGISLALCAEKLADN